MDFSPQDSQGLRAERRGLSASSVDLSSVTSNWTWYYSHLCTLSQMLNASPYLHLKLITVGEAAISSHSRTVFSCVDVTTMDKKSTLSLENTNPYGTTARLDRETPPCCCCCCCGLAVLVNALITLLHRMSTNSSYLKHQLSELRYRDLPLPWPQKALLESSSSIVFSRSVNPSVPALNPPSLIVPRTHLFCTV